jgi:hypothetical protein
LGWKNYGQDKHTVRMKEKKKKKKGKGQFRFLAWELITVQSLVAAAGTLAGFIGNF